MYSVWGSYFLTGGIILWLVILSYLLWKEKKAISDLFPKSGERDIRGKFREVLDKVKGFEGRQKDFDKLLEDFQNKNLENFQKAAFLRYNPYQDTGGDQSFSLVM